MDVGVALANCGYKHQDYLQRGGDWYAHANTTSKSACTSQDERTLLDIEDIGDLKLANAYAGKKLKAV